MKSIFKKIFFCEYIIKSSERQGDLPGNREAYLRVLSIAWPAILESILISLISVVDTAMVSTLGNQAIAAVGISGQPRSIALSVIFSLNVGVTAVVSRRKGENNQEGANRCLKQCLLISAFLAILLSIICIIFARPILLFAGAQLDYIDLAVQYTRIIISGLVFTAVSQTITAAQRGCGKTKISMWTNVGANIVNVILNYLLIGGHLGFPKLGIAGAAIASFTSFVVSALIAIVSAVRKETFINLRYKTSWWFDGATMKAVWKVSSSTAVEQVLFNRVGYFISGKLTASLGTVAFATHQICSNLFSVSLSFTEGFNATASSLMGQSLGEKREDKARLYVGLSQRVAALGAMILMCVYIFLRVPLLNIYDADAAVIALGGPVLILIGLMTNIQTAQNVYTASLRGAGDTRYIAYVSMISVMILRPLLIWLFAYGLQGGLLGVWIASETDQAVRFVFSYARFRSGKWKEIKL